MPTPKEGESQGDFVDRCIPIVVNEGNASDNKQAAAMCYSLWSQHKKDKDKKSTTAAPRNVRDRRLIDIPIRAVEKDGQTLYRACAMRFMSDEDKDWYETYFTKHTDYHLDWWTRRPWLYDHTMNSMVGTVRVGEWLDDIEMTDEGIFFLGQVDERFKYLDAVKTLMDHGMLYPSSGSLGHVANFARDGWAIEWPIAELSSTVAPADLGAASMAPDVRRAVEVLQEGVCTMPGTRKKGFLDLWRDFVASQRDADTESDEDTSPAEEDVGTEGDADAAPAEGEVQDTLSWESAASELGIPRMVEAVQAVDTAVRDLHSMQQALGQRVAQLETLMKSLAQEEIVRVQDAMRGGDWLSGLFSVTRDGQAMAEGNESNVQPIPAVTPTSDVQDPAAALLIGQGR